MRVVASALLKSEWGRHSLQTLSRNRMGFRFLNSLSKPRGVFSSFAEAWSVCNHLQKEAHENTRLINGNFWLSLKTRPSDYPVLFWIDRIGPNKGLTVFDFGGGLGQIYYQYSQRFDPDRFARWIVMDVPEIVEQGRQVSREKEPCPLEFTTSLRDCGGCDLFLAEGAFHYWEHTIADFSDALGGFPSHVLINRSPIREEGPSFVSIQRSNHWAVPCFIRSAKELENQFAQLGYKVIDRWRVAEKTLEFALLPDYKAPYAGFYLRKEE